MGIMVTKTLALPKVTELSSIDIKSLFMAAGLFDINTMVSKVFTNLFDAVKQLKIKLSKGFSWRHKVPSQHKTSMHLLQYYAVRAMNVHLREPRIRGSYVMGIHM